ncbi:MAG TPA: DUF308 domain-containing protein [Candidatus Methylomirabilis sp.]|nr:DUF308 domain-containing protein [Candidatus Methylomirabilis sp.]
MMATRGILAVLFGVVVALWRIPVFDAVIVSFGTYAIVDGILALASALRAARPRTAGWPIAFEGVVSVVLGVLAFTWPFFPQRVIVVGEATHGSSEFYRMRARITRELPSVLSGRGFTLQQPLGGKVFPRIPAPVAVHFAIARELPLEALEARVERQPWRLRRVLDADRGTVRNPHRERAPYGPSSLRTVVVEERHLGSERLHLDRLERGAEPVRDPGA